MFECKMHWDGMIDHNGHIEVRSGIHIIRAENKKEAIKHATQFFMSGAFINYDALLENEKDNFVFLMESE